MKFTRLIAIVAVLGLAASANADGDGTLRRSLEVAQADQSAAPAKEVNININTNAPAASAQAVQQPATTVEAAPVAESKAETLRKTRQEAEVQTEQKIVEKLEDSRLQEERARADRLFGNKLDAAPAAAAVAAPVAPAPAPGLVQDKPAPPPSVTIEKVEIVQPTPLKPEPPVAESKIDTKSELAPAAQSKYYVEGLAGNLSYRASNVKSNYGLGVAVGTILDDHWGVEIGYMYSNHDITDLWSYAIYHQLDQNDVYGAAKYYLMTGKLKPYIGASLTYINRKYSERIYNAYNYPGYSNYAGTSETTNSVDAGVLGGVDFALSDSFMLGAGVDYNFNVMTVNNFDQSLYNLPAGSQMLEQLSYYTIKVTAKFVF